MPEVSVEDDELAERARRGSSSAFAELVRRHQDRVYRFVLRMTGSRDDALDMTQDAFMKAWQAIDRWQPHAQFGTWLIQVARNTALDLLRRRATVGFEPLGEGAEFASAAPAPHDQVCVQQELAQLDAALRAISLEHREVLLLREVEGLSYQEIAGALGVSEGTVKSRISRARSALLKERRGYQGVSA